MALDCRVDSEPPIEDDIFLRVTWPDDQALGRAIMPFVRNGGLFIARNQLGPHEPMMGDKLYLLLEVEAESRRWPVIGRVIWHCPETSHRPPGIGVQLVTSDTGDLLKSHLDRICIMEEGHSY